MSTSVDAAEVPVDAAESDATIEGGRSDAWGRVLRSPKIVVGIAILLIFVVVAILGPVVDTTDPSALTSAILQPPSAHHLLGTTQTGQDVLAQLITGTGITLLVGFVAGAIASALALLLGITAGFVGGITDDLLSALANVFLVIPALPLVIVLAGYLPTKGSISVAIVIAVTGWAWGARVLRAQTLSIRRRDYVDAARVTGEGTCRLIWSEILPNQVAIVAAQFLATVNFAILTQAGLAFLGLSDVNQWSWGTILYWAQNNEAMSAGAWWWFVPPGLCIALVGTALALINFGIDEFINPRLRLAGVATKAAGKQARRDGSAMLRRNRDR